MSSTDNSSFLKGWADGSPNMIAGTVTFLCLTDMLKIANTLQSKLITMLGLLITVFHAIRWYRLNTFPTNDPVFIGNLVDYPLFVAHGIIFGMVHYLLNYRSNHVVFERYGRLQIPAVFPIALGVAYTGYLAFYGVSIFLLDTCKKYYYQFSYCLTLASSYSATLRSFYWIQFFLALLILFYDATFFYRAFDNLLALLLAKKKKNAHSNNAHANAPTSAALDKSTKLLLQHVIIAFFMIITTLIDIVQTTSFLADPNAGFNYDVCFFNTSIHFLVICRVGTDTEAIDVSSMKQPSGASAAAATTTNNGPNEKAAGKLNSTLQSKKVTNIASSRPLVESQITTEKSTY